MVNKMVANRNAIIDRITNTLVSAHSKDLEVDRNKLINELMGFYGAARRTAIEYINSAYARFASIRNNVNQDKNEVDLILEPVSTQENQNSTN